MSSSSSSKRGRSPSASDSDASFLGGHFAEGEKVLCFHGPLLYEARINKVRLRDNKPKAGGVAAPGATKILKYFVHYHGWNKNWDEWVPGARMLKYSESNLDRKRELIRAHEEGVRAKKAAAASAKRKHQEAAAAAAATSSPAAKRVATGGGGDAPPTPAPETQSRTSSSSSKKGSAAALPTGVKKSARLSHQANSAAAGEDKASDEVEAPKSEPQDEEGQEEVEDIDEEEEEELTFSKAEVRVTIPPELKPYLVDDWDFMTRQRKLVMLPARVTVHQVIKDYVEYKKSTEEVDEAEGGSLLEVTRGLDEYFNVMLGSRLLYKFEREQHSDTIKEHPDLPMSKQYGPIHLLRLFVKLGPMLAATPLDDKSVRLLLRHVDGIVEYMRTRAKELFRISDYGTASPEYHRRAL